MIKKKFKIFHKVLSFIQLSKSNSVSHSRDQELFDSQTASPIYDPANLDLPERNFEEFEKITDLSQVQQRPTLFNQMSIDVQTPVAYSPKSSNKNEEGFMIRVSQIKNKVKLKNIIYFIFKCYIKKKLLSSNKIKRERKEGRALAGERDFFFYLVKIKKDLE